MTDRIEDITRAVVYEIITAMGDDGLEALLTADDLLANMAEESWGSPDHFRSRQ